MAICSTDVVREPGTLHFGHSAIPSGWIGTRRGDAPKRDENTRVPDGLGVVGVAPGEAREDMTLQFLAQSFSGFPSWKSVEEELHQSCGGSQIATTFFNFCLPRIFPPVSQVRSESGPPPLGMLQVSR